MKIGKTYTQKIKNANFKLISDKELKTHAKIDEDKIEFKKVNTKFVIATDTEKINGLHINDGRDYLTGEAIVFLRGETGNIETPKEVEIYIEKDGKKKKLYVGKIKDNKYYFDTIINDLQGEYTIYAEAKDNDRKYI